MAPPPLRARRATGPVGRALALVLAAALLGPGGGRAAASPQDEDWRRFVQAPSTADVRPARVVSTSGSVALEQATPSATTLTTLTLAPGGTPPTLLLDYGQDVAGVPFLEVAAVTGQPTLRVAYSESQAFMSPTGDGALPWLNPARYDDVRPTGPARIETALQGGQRFELLTLTTPGSVTLRDVGLHFTGPRFTPDQYQGWFLSSSEALNRLWYAGAYTAQLALRGAGAETGGPAVVDGAKRDRLTWSADLTLAAETLYDSIGSTASPYVTTSLAALLGAPAGGPLPGVVIPGTPLAFFYSAPYSLDPIDALAGYVRYTGDVGFARPYLAAVERELDYAGRLVDGRGLLVTSALDGADWDFLDGPKRGAVAAYNLRYYHALREADYLARHLGRPDLADAWRTRAAKLARAINAHLVTSDGLYALSDEQPAPLAQDANSLAVLYDLAPQRSATILTALRQRLWRAHGALAFSPDAGYPAQISPFTSAMETAARFEAGDTEGALDLMGRLWGGMLRDGPHYTGTFWEALDGDGQPPASWTSLAHGWSSGPTSQLSSYVLGARPVEPGYATWRVQPHPGPLAWARGSVPTPSGPLEVEWSQDPGAEGFTLQVRAPDASSGEVVVPVANPATAAVEVNGVPVWRGRASGPPTATVGSVEPGRGSLAVQVRGSREYTIRARTTR